MKKALNICISGRYIFANNNTKANANVNEYTVGNLFINSILNKL